jgi:hypothetical protein
MKENTYTTVIKEGEFIFTLLLPKLRRNLNNNMKHDSDDTDDYNQRC